MRAGAAEDLTPPSTTMVMTSSSQPCAIDGRVEPSREVRQTAAMPDIRPVRQEQDELDALDADAGERARKSDCCRWRRSGGRKLVAVQQDAVDERQRRAKSTNSNENTHQT